MLLLSANQVKIKESLEKLVALAEKGMYVQNTASSALFVVGV